MAGPTGAGHYLYTAVGFKARRKTIRTAIAALRKHKNKFDGIAFRGFSGGLIAPIVADALGKHIFAVRKPFRKGAGLTETGHHSDNKVEWCIPEDELPKDRTQFRWIFLDDCRGYRTREDVRLSMAAEGFNDQPVFSYYYTSGDSYYAFDGLDGVK